MDAFFGDAIDHLGLQYLKKKALNRLIAHRLCIIVVNSLPCTDTDDPVFSIKSHRDRTPVTGFL